MIGPNKLQTSATDTKRSKQHESHEQSPRVHVSHAADHSSAELPNIQEGQNTGDSGGGKGTTFPCDVSDLFAGQMFV